MKLEPLVAGKAKENQVIRKGEQAGTTCQNSDKLKPIDTKRELAKVAGKAKANQGTRTDIPKNSWECSLAEREKAETEDRRNYWGRLAVWATRRLGELISDGQKNGKIHDGKGRPNLVSHDATLKLSDLGLTRSESSRAQQIAAIPEEELVTDGQKNGKIAARGGDRKSKSHDATLKLADLGLTRSESSRAQQMAAIPEEEVEKILDEQEKGGEVEGGGKKVASQGSQAR